MSTDLSKRHLVHMRNVKGNFDYSPVFYAAVNKYGWNAFRLCILETIKVESNKDLKKIRDIYDQELFYFNLLKPCYNVNPEYWAR